MKESSHKVETMYLLTFVVHCGFCFFVTNTNSLAWVDVSTQWLAHAYGAVGFRWSGHGAYVVSAGALSALALNMARRAAEGLLLGWPRYRSHDRVTLVRSWVRAFLYMTMVIAALGFFGEKYSKLLSVIDVFLVCIGTFIFGLFVNVLDDAIASLLVFLNEGK